MAVFSGLPFTLSLDTRLPPPQTVTIVAFYDNGQFVSASAGTVEEATAELEAAIAAGKVTG